MNINNEGSKSIRQKGHPAKTRNYRWDLHLYVAGQAPRGITAFKNLKVICEEQIKGKYHIKVVDLLKDPKIAHDEQILAVPTLVRKLPLPVRNIIGDLSNTERVLIGLGIIDQNMAR